jgi:cytochrome b561
MDESQSLIYYPLGQPERQAARFDGISQALHWLTVLLVIGQFISGLLHDQRHGASAELLLTFHRSAGIATWIVVLIRLLWRRWFAYLPPFPAAMPRAQQWVAKLNEYGLYALLLVQPLTGLATMMKFGHPFTLFLWQIPALMAQDKSLAHMLKEIHETGAWILAALIGLHAVAALFHGLVLRDRVLQRMMPDM